jgi:predicted nucleotide-binding protein
MSAEEFHDEVFRVLDSLMATRYSRRIFIVHGRDHPFRDALVTTLERLDFSPIVLQQNPGQGRTIIENIELESASAGFAFVLYTPDDVGRVEGGTDASRPRQNVVFEHGVLIGVLGRDRTCALIKGDMELPTDIDGLVYEPVGDLVQDSLNIARVLKHAGYEVDVSQLL